jgi:Flp pilus assembly protein TadB
VILFWKFLPSVAFVIVAAGIGWYFWSIARATRERNRLERASENARQQAERDEEAAWIGRAHREQQALDDLSARTFVQADPGTTETVPGPAGSFAIVGTASQDPGGAKARALLARAKLAKAKKRARKKK